VSVITMQHVTVSQQLSTMLYVYVIVMECSTNARFCSEESLPYWNWLVGQTTWHIWSVTSYTASWRFEGDNGKL